MMYDYNNSIELLEKYADGSATETEQATAENLMQSHPELQEEYEYMKIAIKSVKLSALHRQVSNIGAAYNSNTNLQFNKTKPANVRSIGFYAVRVAAVLLVVLSSYYITLYATLTPDKLYSDYFEAYNSTTFRNASKGLNTEQLYKLQRWDEVLQNASKESSAKDRFLAGLAALQLNKPQEASVWFNGIINNNTSNSEKSFSQESEFYLALAYIKLKNYDAAKELIIKMQQHPEHPYHKQAEKMSLLKTSILSFKK